MPIGLTTAAVVGGGLAAAGAVGSAVISSNASKKAVNATQAAADQATAEQKREYDQTRTDQQPWLTTGTSALSSLSKLYGLDSIDPNTSQVVSGASQPGVDPNATFYQSPDYQFTQSEGLKAIEARNAALGLQDSGARIKAEGTFAGNLADQNFNQYANRLQALAGVGQTAAGTDANAGSNYANQVSNIAQNAGDAKASSYLVSGQNQAGALQSLAGIGQGLITNLPGGGGMSPFNISPTNVQGAIRSSVPNYITPSTYY